MTTNPLKIKTSALAAGALIGISASASAVIVYTNDFEAETLGAVSGTPFGHSGHSSSSTSIVAGQNWETTGRSGNFNYSFPFFDGGTITPTGSGFASVTTFKFDMSVDAANWVGLSQMRLRSRDTGGHVGANDHSRGADLDVGEITVGTVNTIELVVNNSAALADAPSVGGTIASGTYALYVNSTLLHSGSNFTAADDLAVDYLTLWVRGQPAIADDPGTPGIDETMAGVQTIVSMDNFEVHVNPVPEPSSAALLGLGALGFVLRRRK